MLSAAGAVAAALLMVSCGEKAGACGQPLREPLDPNSAQHIIDPKSATYSSTTPTSGPHLFTLPLRGTVARTLSPAEQVTVLETGDVLIQYRDSTALDTLRPMVRPGVTVAPNAALDTAIVATSWTWKLRCSTLDVEAIERFAAPRIGKAAH